VGGRRGKTRRTFWLEAKKDRRRGMSGGRGKRFAEGNLLSKKQLGDLSRSRENGRNRGKSNTTRNRKQRSTSSCNYQILAQGDFG